MFLECFFGKILDTNKKVRQSVIFFCDNGRQMQVPDKEILGHKCFISLKTLDN